MVQLSNQIAEIDRQLAAEVSTLKISYKAAYESVLEPRNGNEEAHRELKQDVLDLQKRSIQYNILKREVDTNQSLYDGLLQRYKEVDIAGGVGANNVFIVDKATLPGGPSSPNMSRALLMSFALGLGDCAWRCLCARASRRYAALARRRRTGIGVCHARDHSQRSSGTHDLEAELADPRSHIVGGLSFAVYGVAAFDRKRLAENAAGDQRRARRGQVDDRSDDRAAFRQYRPQGSPGRRRSAEAVAAYQTQARQRYRA